MFSRLSLPILAGLLAFPLLPGCDRGKTAVTAAPKGIEERFQVRVGELTVRMQLAVTEGEMEHGLMFRQAMDEDEGMLFIYDTPQQMNFWMRNCTLPLDIGYFEAGGELKEIYPMYPRDERTVSSRSHSLEYALEMNQGWYARHGVKPGAKLDLPAVAAALQARGFKPGVLGRP